MVSKAMPLNLNVFGLAATKKRNGVFHIVYTIEHQLSNDGCYCMPHKYSSYNQSSIIFIYAVNR